MIRRDKQWEEVAMQLANLSEQRKELQKQEKELSEKLKALSEGKPSYFGTWMYTVTYRQGSVDYSKIPQLSGVDLDAYRGEDVAVWQLAPNTMLTSDEINERLSTYSPQFRAFITNCMDGKKFSRFTDAFDRFVDQTHDVYISLVAKGRLS